MTREIEKKFEISFRRICSSYDRGQLAKIYSDDSGVVGDVITLRGDFTLNQLNEIKCMLDYFMKHPELNQIKDPLEVWR